MEILLQANANINAAEHSGYRPIDMAYQLCLPEVVRFLDQFDCDLEFGSPTDIVESAIYRDLLGVTQGAETLEAVLETIVNRRRKLQNLVLNTLPEVAINLL